MPFNIINCENNEAYRSDLTEEVYVFSTAEDASNFAKALSQDLGGKFKIKRCLDDKWKERESRKFANGVYEYLPWANADWWTSPKAYAIHRDHFAHPSKTDPGKVAYTESPEKGVADIRTQIRPGRYLEKFHGLIQAYGHSTSYWIAEFDRRFAPKQLRFAATEKEIERVYISGVESCMGSSSYRKHQGYGWPKPGKWPHDIHACRMYAAGDLQVAYILESDDKEASYKVAGRSVVWPAKKTHSRIYGDVARMKSLLSAAGYSFHPPTGAKLLRHRVKEAGNVFLVPYIDAGDRTGQGSMAVVDHEDHLKICYLGRGVPHNYAASNVSGLSSPPTGPDGRHIELGGCAVCHTEDIAVAIVYIDNDNNYEHWCGNCIAANAFKCDGSHRLYSKSFQEPLELADGRIWSQRYFNANGFTCQGNGRRYARGNAVRLKTGELWSYDYAIGQKHAVCCAYTGYWVRVENTIQMHNGEYWSNEAYALYGFTCEDCERKISNSYKDRCGMPGKCVRCAERSRLNNKANIGNVTTQQERPNV